MNIIAAASDNTRTTDRLSTWFTHYRPLAERLNADFLLAVSNSNEVKSDWTVPVVQHKFEQPNRYALSATALNVFTFDAKLPPRSSVFTYPEWWRSFASTVLLARLFDCDKVYFIESDCYVLTSKLLKRMLDVKTGYSMGWCPRHGFAETQLNVICRDMYDTVLQAVLSRSWEEWGRVSDFENGAERFLSRKLPVTIWTDLVGDRYPEYGPVPEDADFVAQGELHHAMFRH